MLLVEREIGVAHIAPADDGDGVVDRDDLVVHALVEARKVEQQLAVAQIARVEGGAEGIVDAHVDVGMIDDLLERLGIIVDEIAVDQRADMHAPLRRAEQRLADRAAAAVEIPDVILQVDGARRRLDGNETRLIGILPALEKEEAGMAGGDFLRRHQRMPERGLFRLGKGGAGRKRRVVPHRRAGAEQQRKPQNDRQKAVDGSFVPP